MEFINVAALWGAALIAVPIIIHLITRRRALRKPFAAMRFVLLSHQHLKRRMRLKRILILLARIMAVVALAMLIAHPTLPAARNVMQMGDEPRSLVLIIDNSASMLATIDGKRPWDDALALMTGITESIGADHEVALLFTNGNGDKVASSFSANPGDLKDVATTLKPSFIFRPVTDSLVEAVGMLDTARNELKQVVLVTDLQRSAWSEGLVTSNPGARLVVLDVGGDAPYPANASIASVELVPSAGEARYTAGVDVLSFGDEDMPGREVTVMVGDEARARGFFDLPMRGRTRKQLTFSAEGRGILRGRAHISPDALHVDNDRYFTARAGGRIKALVVDGDPKAERYGAESYYLMNALNPKLEARSRIEPTLVTSVALGKTNFQDYDLVIMTNVRDISPKVLEKLKNYVAEGGALLISLGDNIDRKTFATEYGNLVPADLYILNELPEPTHIDIAEIDHPAMEMFSTIENGDISLAEFNKYYMLDLTVPAAADTKTVLEFQDGAPALVEKPYGRGRVALWTSTLDRDWNNMCIYPTYLPVLQQLSLYLTGGMADPVGTDYLAGRTARFTCPENASAAWIFGPGGPPEKVELSEEEELKQGALLLEGEPGFREIYCVEDGKLSRKPDREPDRLLAVNMDTRESDLERWDRAELEKSLDKMGFDNPAVVKDLRELADREGFKSSRRDAARLMLMALAAMLLLEGALTRKG